MKVLVINAGSSSLKYQLFDMENESVLAKGLAERIGIEGSKLTHQPAGRDKVEFVRDMPTHTEAIEMVLDALVDKDCGVISSMKEIGAVGHRVLHGGRSTPRLRSSTTTSSQSSKSASRSVRFIIPPTSWASRPA